LVILKWFFDAAKKCNEEKLGCVLVQSRLKNH
jgi:hypothetical protein